MKRLSKNADEWSGMNFCVEKCSVMRYNKSGAKINYSNYLFRETEDLYEVRN